MFNLIVLRSYGDFVVLMNTLKSSERNEKIVIYASLHLRPLWESLNATFVKDNISFEFVDFNINRGILAFFTNKYLLSRTSIRELLSLNSFLSKNNLKNNQQTYFEQRRRSKFLNLLLASKIKFLHKEGNIYKNYFQFFNVSTNPNIIDLKEDISQILIFPDSRKKIKVIPVSLQEKICQFGLVNNIQITIALFGKSNLSSEHHIYYENFYELVHLIQNAQFIISSDSLPVHLAQYFNKPHFAFYPNNINYEWVTPWISENGMCSTFDKPHLLFNKIKS